jgi:Protein of unknown function (DUF2637)
VNADRSDPRASGSRQVPLGGGRDSQRPVLSGPVSTLDRLTLHLGVAVAVVIALCSYAVSASSLYALGIQAGYGAWQAVAVPVVADGPAIYGMFRIVSRSRRRAKGAGYGWLLVSCGTAASIGGNVAHAQPDLVAQGIAAAIPLAVLAMLEGLKGDAGEVTRLAATGVQGSIPEVQADRLGVDGHPSSDTTVRRSDTSAVPVSDLDGLVSSRDGQVAKALAARPAMADAGVQGRLRAAHARVRPDGGPWTARTLAEAAGCGRSTAAAFLRARREQDGEAER